MNPPATGTPRRLWLIRHAAAAGGAGGGDLERPLTARGEADARLIGSWLSAGRVHPDWVVSSNAVRALATAASIREHLFDARAGADDVPPVIEPRLYAATPPALIDVIRETPPGCRALAVVGHNPTVSELGRILGAMGTALPPGGVLAFDVDGDWQDLRGSGQTTFLGMVTPAQLTSGQGP